MKLMVIHPRADRKLYIHNGFLLSSLYTPTTLLRYASWCHDYDVIPSQCEQ